MSSVCLVASMNGSGHFARLLAYALELSSRKIPLVIVASDRHQKRFENELTALLSTSRNKLLTAAEPNGLDGPQWVQTFGQIVPPSREIQAHVSRARLTVSDNVIWPSEYARQFVLVGQFLWADYWHQHADVSRMDLVRADQELIRQGTWPWLRNPVFGMESGSIGRERVKDLPSYFESNDLLAAKFPLADEIWINAGTTGLPFDFGTNLTSNEALWPVLEIDTSRMLKRRVRPRLVVSRPGFGTIRDCIARGVPISLPSGGGDLELLHNVEVMKEIGLSFPIEAAVGGSGYSTETFERDAYRYSEVLEGLRETLLRPIERVVDQILDEGSFE